MRFSVSFIESPERSLALPPFENAARSCSLKQEQGPYQNVAMQILEDQKKKKREREKRIKAKL